MHKLYVIAGPTASGKTAIAVELAKQLGGEVISADSMQIYRGMDIGTAKPTLEERQNIPHHMIDIVNPDEAYSAALYQQQARTAIEDVRTRGRVPILCGGTGFYINAVLYDVKFVEDEETDNSDTAMRDYFMDLAAKHGPEYLYAKLLEVDHAAASILHPNNVKRVARALSYCHVTGLLFSDYNAVQKKCPPVYDTVFCRLSVNRPMLYQRINQRAQAMFDAGLIAEVSGLMSQGYSPGLVSMQGIGYKEVVRFIQGECTQPEAVDAVQQNSRRYAKRQETWFRHQNPDALVVSADGQLVDIIEKIVQEICH